MTFFKKRSVALFLCILAVLFSILGNTRWKLGAQAQRVNDFFYAEDSVAPQLKTIVSEGEALAAVAERLGLETGGLRDSAGTLRWLLQDRSFDIAGIYHVYDVLRYELRTVEQTLLSSSLSAEDAAAVSQSLERIHSAQAAISSASYNEQVSRFLSRNGGALTRILAKLAGVSYPEVFA